MFSEILRCPLLVGASNCTQLMNHSRMNSRNKDEILCSESSPSMEEGEDDVSPSFSERGHDDHDGNNNINPWEDKGAQANRGDDDDHDNMSRSKGLKLRFKIIKTDQSKKKSKVCHICNKGGFTTSEALLGHMRMHSLSTKLALKAKQGTHHVSSTTNNNTNCCYLCRKSFPTIKSLCGHMRSHPEREWRGIQPPLHLHVASSSNSTSSSSNHSASAPAVVDLSRSLPRWSATAKRGRKCLSPSCQNNLRRVGLEEVEKHHMQEGVYELMLLAGVAPKKTVLQCQEEDTYRMKMKKKKKKNKLAGCSVESSDSLKSFNKIGYEEEEEDQDSDFQNSDHGSIVGTDMGVGNRNENKLNEIGTTVQGNETKTFVENAVVGSCSINKTFSFSTGEALGDHKMIYYWNWTQREEAQSSQAASLVEYGQSCPKNLSFDLNLPATMDEEEEGIQSDSIIPPTNILPSSYHASSSQNSVNN